ncbi:hypothetical protein KP509_36G051500 [Ceratopteris richardii]|uniref:Uncharacterized protein n=1 Tax=Ceratopteris richardii TaxID=49495 RepID=A0A8T2QD34_CERRI|nr:hypothetical protein KP509_36G051500 [Ceratopteris richardii]
MWARPVPTPGRGANITARFKFSCTAAIKNVIYFHSISVRDSTVSRSRDLVNVMIIQKSDDPSAARSLNINDTKHLGGLQIHSSQKLRSSLISHTSMFVYILCVPTSISFCYKVALIFLYICIGLLFFFFFFFFFFFHA